MKIIIADDHDLVREALSSLVIRDDSSAEIIQADSLPPVLQALTANSGIDLVLLDVHMPGMEDIQIIEQITTDYPNIPVVMMSGVVSRTDVDLCFQYGARGFIPKTLNGNALVSVLKMVLSGIKYVPDVMLEQQTQSTTPNTHDLSKREHQVLQLLFEGQSNKIIAQNLYIEETTVKLHLRSLFKKLNAKNRTELVIKAIKAGYSKEND